MNERKDAAVNESLQVEVELIADHTHDGKLFKKGEKITVRKRQLEKLREWGKVK